MPPEDKPSTPFLLDHPDRVGDIESEEQFQQLKDKVELMYKGLRVDQRAYMIKHKKISMDTKASDKTITKLSSLNLFRKQLGRRRQALRAVSR